MTKDIQREKTLLLKKIAKLDKQELRQLRQERRAAVNVVARLDAKIAKIARSGKRGVTRRKRTSPAKMKELIRSALRKGPKGLSLSEISKGTKLPYGSVVSFLDRNPKEFRSEGEYKKKRYFLK